MPPLDAFESKPDSIDGRATLEFYIMKAAKVLHEPLHAAMAPAVGRALHHVHERYACPTCVVCFSLIRRYLERERRELGAHQDMQALVSVVFTLNAEDYDGGLYLMVNYSSPRNFLPLRTGDAVVHEADLLHGVHVSRGDRWSWSLWIKPEADCLLFVTVKRHFTAADLDGDGRLGEEEAGGFAAALSLRVAGGGEEPAGRRLLRAADTNQDGQLDAYEAFTVIFKSTLPAMASK